MPKKLAPTMRLFAVLLSVTGALAVRAAEKPNIIFVFADDMGFGDRKSPVQKSCHSKTIGLTGAGVFSYVESMRLIRFVPPSLKK